MNRSLATISVAAIAALTLAGCSTSQQTETAPTESPTTTTTSTGTSESPSTTTTSTSTSESLVPRGSSLTGELGKVHGMDCAALGDCSVTFTINELTRAQSCSDALSQNTEGNLVHVSGTISSKAEPYNPDFAINTWPVFTDWSTVGSDGLDKPIEILSSCLPESGWRGTWDQEIRPGDTRAFSQYMEIPEGADTLRITDTINGGGRWEFAIPAQE